MNNKEEGGNARERHHSADDQSPQGTTDDGEQGDDEDRYGEPGMGTADTHTEGPAHDPTILREDPLVRVRLPPRTSVFLHTPPPEPVTRPGPN